MRQGISVAEVPAIGPAVITLGVFDGVHVGHRHLLAETVQAAAERDAAPVAIVFTPHPDEVFRPGTSVARLLPPEETISRLAGLGLRHVLEVAFDDELRAMGAEEFLASLAPGLELRAITMTPGSAFGRGREGTLERVTEIGARRGFDVVPVDPLTIDGRHVSSTDIRSALAAGDLATATRLLAGPPQLRGVVVSGDRRGRTLGFPTANLSFGYTPALPPLGIYLGRVSVADRKVPPAHPALVSIGVRPTFHDDGRVLVEAYLLDWSGDLYGATMDLEITDHLREERRFASVEALVEQMRADEAEAHRRIGR